LDGIWVAQDTVGSRFVADGNIATPGSLGIGGISDRNIDCGIALGVSIVAKSNVAALCGKGV
jgi:hypothetical protein